MINFDIRGVALLSEAFEKGFPGYGVGLSEFESRIFYDVYMFIFLGSGMLDQRMGTLVIDDTFEKFLDDGFYSISKFEEMYKSFVGDEITTFFVMLTEDLRDSNDELERYLRGLGNDSHALVYTFNQFDRDLRDAKSVYYNLYRLRYHPTYVDRFRELYE